MPTPQFTLTASLQDVLGDNEATGTMRAFLCNYGARIPVVAGTSVLARVFQEAKQPTDATTKAQLKLWGNDQITPGTTFYCIQIVDANNRVVQSSNYLLTGSGTFDLSDLTPITIVIPPPIIPPNSLLEIVAQSATPIFHANTYRSFKLVPNQPATSSSIVGGVPGLLYTFCVLQGGAPFPVAWPPNTVNMPDVMQVPFAMTTQVCMCDENLNFVAAAGGTIYVPGS